MDCTGMPGMLSNYIGFSRWIGRILTWSVLDFSPIQLGHNKLRCTCLFHYQRLLIVQLGIYAICHINAILLPENDKAPFTMLLAAHILLLLPDGTSSHSSFHHQE